MQPRRLARGAGGGDLFLRVLSEHEESDVVVVCRAHPAGLPKRPHEVEFFCHSEVLRRSCSVFADAAEFELLSQRVGAQAGFGCEAAPASCRRRQRFELWADDDIVFEVLRYVYCGAVYFHLGFRARFSQFLAVVDFLGVEDMAERRRPGGMCISGSPTSLAACPMNNTGTATSLFAEPGVEQWLRDLQTEDVLRLLQDDGIAAALSHGVGAVGFSVLCNFLAKLIELRPQDLTVEVLGEKLYRRLADFGAPAADCDTSMSNQPSEACQVSRTCASRPSPRPRLLHLPGPVVYVDLCGGGVRCANLGGLEPIIGPAAEIPRSLRHDMLASLEVAMELGDESRSPGRFYHDGHLLEAGVVREALLKDGVPPHQEVVVFQESSNGRDHFDATLRRAQLRTPAERAQLASALDGLVAEAALQAPRAAEGGPEQRPHVRVEYHDHHEMAADLALHRDFDRNGPCSCLVLAGVRPGGRAEAAGVGAGWTLGRHESQDLIISAPLPGALGVATSAEWGSLAGLWIELRAPAHEMVTLEFSARPFGFSWAQELGCIVIREVKPHGRASGRQVHRGMLLSSIAFGSEPPITSVVDIIEALRSERAPATLTFGWRRSKKALTARSLAGVSFEETAAPTGPGGANPSEGGSPERVVVVSQVPATHPAALEGVGPGWQVLAIQPHPTAWRETLVTSLGQLPAKLVDPTVRLSFWPPAPLHGLLPLDRSKEGEVCPPEEWATTAGGAIERALPWCELTRCDVGPLRRFRLQARPLAAEQHRGSGASAPAAPSAPSAASSASSSAPAVSPVPGGLEALASGPFEVVVLGQVPPTSRAAEQRIRSAGPHDPLAWEVRQVLETVLQGALFWPLRRLVVVALRQSIDSGPPLSPPVGGPLPAATQRGWLGGLLFGESVPHIMYHLALRLQRRPAQLPGGPPPEQAGPVPGAALQWLQDGRPAGGSPESSSSAAGAAEANADLEVLPALEGDAEDEEHYFEALLSESRETSMAVDYGGPDEAMVVETAPGAEELGADLEPPASL